MTKFQLVAEFDTTDEIADGITLALPQFLNGANIHNSSLKVISEHNPDVSFLVPPPARNVEVSVFGYDINEVRTEIGKAKRVGSEDITIRLDLEVVKRAVSEIESEVAEGNTRKHIFLYVESTL